MSQRSLGVPSRWTLAAIALALAGLGTGACSRSLHAGELEEVPTAENDVPVEIREVARSICKRLGGARCAAWYWDREDTCWETTLVGLSRTAELDILPDGTFDELELVYGLDEVDAVLPEVGRTIREKCRTDTGLVIELSLRREAYLDDPPPLAAAWHQDGVVLEFQGPNGDDFEMDAKGMLVEHPMDDISDRAPARR